MGEHHEGPLPKQLLDSWEVPPPPADLESRVFAALEPPRRWPWWALRLAVATVTALVVWTSLRPPAPEERLLTLGGRVAVRLYGDAEVAPEPARPGEVRCQQRRGRASYDVRPGPMFVSTPGGDVIVQGTQFDVEVVPMKTSTLASVAVAATVVTVTSGRVLLSNGHGEVALGPSETGVMTADTAPRVQAEGASSDAVSLERALSQAEAARAKLALEVAALEARAAAQKAELERHAWDVEGRPGAWPPHLPAALSAARFPEEVKRVFDEASSGSRLVTVDCHEYPCAVVAVTESEKVNFSKGLEALLAEGESTVFANESKCADAGRDELWVVAFALEPAADGGEARNEALAKRLRSRYAELTKQYTCSAP
jgi:hypothetical protein